MAGEQKGSFRFNSKPFVILRVVAYIIIIACLYFWGRQGRRSASAEKTSAPTPAQPSDGKTEPTVDLTPHYPSVTMYGWSVRPADEGQQQVDVLVKFGKNSEEVKYSDLKLRAKGSGADIATAKSPGESENAKLGLGKLTFLVPAGQPEFRSGSVFCWVKDLCVLNSNQRLAPPAFDEWVDQMKREAAEVPTKEPDATQPDGPPPATTPQAVQVPTSV